MDRGAGGCHTPSTSVMHISLFLGSISFFFPYSIYFSYTYIYLYFLGQCLFAFLISSTLVMHIFVISWVNLFLSLFELCQLCIFLYFFGQSFFFLSLFHLYQFGIFLYFCDQSRFSFPIQSILVI